MSRPGPGYTEWSARLCEHFGLVVCPWQVEYLRQIEERGISDTFNEMVRELEKC